MADLKTRRYYVDVPRWLSPYYVDLTKLNLRLGAPLRKLVVATSNGLEKPATTPPHSLAVSKPDELWDIK